MTRVTLIRHGQANSDLLNYDQLSDLGRQQMHCLGRFYQQHWANPERHSGTLQRHRQSDAAVEEVLKTSASVSDTRATHSNPAWNEFDFLDIIGQHRPEWQKPEALVQALAKHADGQRYFLRQFKQALAAWMADEGGGGYRESWMAFNQRIRSALCSLDPNQEHWIITSGGVISALLGQALELNPGAIIKLTFALNNASITTLMVRDNAIRIESFNQLQHFYGQTDLMSFF